VHFKVQLIYCIVATQNTSDQEAHTNKAVCRTAAVMIVASLCCILFPQHMLHHEPMHVRLEARPSFLHRLVRERNAAALLAQLIDDILCCDLHLQPLLACSPPPCFLYYMHAEVALGGINSLSGNELVSQIEGLESSMADSLLLRLKTPFNGKSGGPWAPWPGGGCCQRCLYAWSFSWMHVES